MSRHAGKSGDIFRSGKRCWKLRLSHWLRHRFFTIQGLVPCERFPGMGSTCSPGESLRATRRLAGLSLKARCESGISGFWIPVSQFRGTYIRFPECMGVCLNRMPTRFGGVFLSQPQKGCRTSTESSIALRMWFIFPCWF